MKKLGLLAIFFLSTPLLAFDSYKNFPIEKMRSFIQMTTTEQLSHLQSLNIDIYKFPKFKYSSQEESQFEVMSHLDEVPAHVVEIISKHDADLVNAFNKYSNDNIGVFFSSRSYQPLKNTILLGAKVNPFIFYHEVSHAFLELEEVKSKELIPDHIYEEQKKASDNFMKAFEENKINSKILMLFPLKLNFMITNLKDSLIEEAAVDHHLLHILDLNEINERDIQSQVEYLRSNCSSILENLDFYVDLYTNITSKHHALIKSNTKLKLAMIESKDLLFETVKYYDQVCVFNQQSEVAKKYISFEIMLQKDKERIVKKLNR